MSDDPKPGRAPDGAPPLFRREAVEHRAGHRLQSDVLRLGRAGIGAPGLLLLLGVVAAAIASARYRLPVRASGPAIVVEAPAADGTTVRSVLAVLPERARDALAPGDTVEFLADGDPARPLALPLVALGDAARAPADARCTIETRAVRDGLRGATVVLRLGAPPAGATGGHVRARLGSERLLLALFPDLQRVWPNGVR